MLAARVHDYRPAGPLSIDEIPVPSPAADEILIRVAASSVNPADWKVRDGMLRDHIPLALPFIPGGDVSGEVAGLGARVDGFAIGDAVYAMAGTQSRYALGGFAEYVAVPASHVAPKPASLSHVEAATVPLAALTAWQALYEEGGRAPGVRVLIHAAAGGVGRFAVQFAVAAGADVVGTASAANRDRVLALGARAVIDYQAAPFEEAVGAMDLVIDLVGGDVQLRSLSVLRKGATLVNAWGKLASAEAEAAGIVARKVAVRPDGRQLRRIGALIDNGELVPSVSHVFPLTDVEAAFALSRSGHGHGKIAIRIADL